METNRLRQFKVIVDAGGLLKASDLLGISGGGLSKSMKALEDELGFKLFSQRGRGLELTRAGRELYDRIPSVLNAIDSLTEASAFETKPTHVIRLVSFEVFTTHFLASVAGRILSGRPLDIREAIPGQMEEIIANGEADFGITYLPIPRAEVEFHKVSRVQMSIYGAKGVFKDRKFADLPFAVPIAPIRGTPTGVQGLDGWPDHLISRRIQYRVEMMETAIQLCRRGVAVSFLPDFVVKIANQTASEGHQLVSLPLPADAGKVQRDVYVVQKKGISESRELRELARLLRTL